MAQDYALCRGARARRGVSDEVAHQALSGAVRPPDVLAAYGPGEYELFPRRYRTGGSPTNRTPGDIRPRSTRGGRARGVRLLPARFAGARRAHREGVRRGPGLSRRRGASLRRRHDAANRKSRRANRRRKSERAHPWRDRGGKELVAEFVHRRSPRPRQAVRTSQLCGGSPRRSSTASCSGTSGAPSPAPTKRRRRAPGIRSRGHRLPRRGGRASPRPATEAAPCARGRPSHGASERPSRAV